MKTNFSIRKVQVLIRVGHMDIINIFVDLPTTFPELKYETVLETKARHGYGEQWSREVLGVEPEILVV